MSRIMAEIDIAKALQTVRSKISAASKPQQRLQPRLVAVSKTKPKELIIAAYREGQRHFGENYIQELIEKSNNQEILRECPDIKWHFIGRVQSNKVPKLVSVPNLYVVETLDSEKLAAALNRGWSQRNNPTPLNVMIQVNTSGEVQKGGVEPSETASLAQYVVKECASLKFFGIMTIGMASYDPSTGPNPDFVNLVKCRDAMCEKLGLDRGDIELSMGMSADYVHAIELGSTNVRVGSTIFGQRDYTAKK
uniref:Pyridoxal phosphate homeostasis protein n=1 Tax=Ornithodoros turicata TaxID=34597 RepID=A0A2R5LIY6_9ACAR